MVLDRAHLILKQSDFEDIKIFNTTEIHVEYCRQND
jgi:hypothetical protein